MKHYRSSIPPGARERVTARHIAGRGKYKAEYRIGGQPVGVRTFYETGELMVEQPWRDGQLHGTVYWCSEPGVITFAEPYFKGHAHGIARQWSEGGKLIGTYSMRYGTGIDLWRCADFGTGAGCYLSEARFIKDDKWHGFEWWLNPDQKSVWQERHFRRNQLHGIEREWNHRGGLRRGYPRYWVNDQRVTKRQYLRAAAADPSLPRFRELENRPRRQFPAEVQAVLGPAT